MDASKPKPPTKQTPDDLAEVERALSVLQGRHPEHERARREDAERRVKRKAELEAQRSAETRRTLLRRLAIGGAGAVVFTIAVVAALGLRSEFARRGRLEQAADPYRAAGFLLVDSSSR